MITAERYKKVIDYFRQQAPEAATELTYTNPYELLVAVMLSAQCTDKRVNLTTPALFQQYPTVFDLAEASVDEVFALIRSISYPNNKARHLVAAARQLVDQHQGNIPSKIEDLVKLPGVGRKTANVVVSVVFDQPAMAVDTHVFRVSARIGLTKKAKTPLEAEKQLMRHLPTEVVAVAHHWLILHGRYICVARKPKCTACGLTDVCIWFKKNQQQLKKNQQQLKKNQKHPTTKSVPHEK
jgi:endonuclease-3